MMMMTTTNVDLAFYIILIYLFQILIMELLTLIRSINTTARNVFHFITITTFTTITAPQIAQLRLITSLNVTNATGFVVKRIQLRIPRVYATVCPLPMQCPSRIKMKTK